MMKIYHQQNKEKKQGKVLMLIIGVIILIVGADYILSGKIRGAARIAVEPMVYLYTLVADTNAQILGHIYTKNTLLKENNTLKLQIAELNYVREVQEVLESEMRELRNIAEGVLTADSIVARVLSTQGMGTQGTILIENPHNTFVAGDTIRTRAGGAIGIIESTLGGVATGILFSAPNKKTEVRIGEVGITAEAIGSGGKNMVITLPRDADVVVGDMVTAREFGGYAIGIVGDIALSDSDAFKVVRVLLIGDPSIMRFVIIEHDAR